MQIQYISTTHTSKDLAKKHKKEVNTFHNIYYKDATFEEIASLLDAGCTIARVGNTTEFVAIDIDKTSININTVYEHYKNNPDYAVSYSASNNPLKWHLLVNLHKTITREEYRNELQKVFEDVCKELKTRFDFIELDTNADKFDQCFFGQSVENEIEVVLPGSTRLYKWCKQNETPMIYKTEKTIKVHPSLNSADYCKKHNLLTIQENKRFDIYLPSMTKGKLKLIAEGHRYNWCKIIGAKLLMRIFYLNENFEENWNKWDYLDTFEWVVRTNVIRPDEFVNTDDYKGLVRFFDNKYDILFDKDFDTKCEVLEGYFKTSKRQYKSRLYNPTVYSQIIQNYLFDTNTIVFTDKEELQNICKDYTIDYYKFLKYTKSLGYNVAFEVETNRTNKGKCLEGFTVENNTVQIPKALVTGSIRKYCSINKIKIVRI